MSRLRTGLQAALMPLGLARLGRWAHRKTLLVLTYHSVVDAPEAALRGAPFLYRNSVTASQFRQQLRYLHRHHMLVDAATVEAALDGQQPWPEGAVLITFDDGLRNNATVAAPILAETNTPAVFFLPTDFLDAASAGTSRIHWSEHLAARLTFGGPEARQAVMTLCPSLEPTASLDTFTRAAIRHLKPLAPDERATRLVALPPFDCDPTLLPADRFGSSIFDTMTWDEARALPEIIRLGAHGQTHNALGALSLADAGAEVMHSVWRVTDETAAACRLFAYPYGEAADTNPALAPTFEQAGLAGVFTQQPGSNRPSNPTRWQLQRINVPGLPTAGVFQYHASGLHARLRA